MTDLDKLIDAVEGGKYDQDGTRPARFNALCSDWEAARGAYSNPNYKTAWLAYCGSLDAAKALHDALLPGWDWGVYADKSCWLGSMDIDFSEKSTCPARAWLLAILKAYRSTL